MNIMEIRWHGRGGQGAKTASLLLADAAFMAGKFVQSFPEYGPERSGAPITAYNRISDERCSIHSNIYEPDYVAPVEEISDPNALEIDHYGNTWLVTGTWLERLVENINFDDYEARNYFDLQLRKCGLFTRLEEMGIQDGDTVDIYNFEFEYQK